MQNIIIIDNQCVFLCQHQKIWSKVIFFKNNDQNSESCKSVNSCPKELSNTPNCSALGALQKVRLVHWRQINGFYAIRH